MSDDPLICDTGALIDYLVATAPDHDAFREAIDAARTRYVPALVLAEVDYFLREEREAMAALIANFASGAFTFAAVDVPLLERAMEIDRRFADLQLGLPDATIVALAEEIEVLRLATRDVADFTPVRLRDGSAFELVVHPSRPDR